MSASKDALLPGYSRERGLVDPHVVDGTERNEALIRDAWAAYELLNPSGFKINGAPSIRDFVRKLSDGRFLSECAGFAFEKSKKHPYPRPEAFGTDDASAAERFARCVYFVAMGMWVCILLFISPAL
jgi:hypothetical protein